MEARELKSPLDSNGSVIEMFDRISGAYDLLNALMSVGRDRMWRHALARRAAGGRGGRVLDLAAGTGDTALAFSDVMSGERLVVGLDASAPMLARARAKGRARRRLVWAEGDAHELPLADGVFDCSAMVFGLRNLADPARVLGEMARVTRAGGSVSILEFTLPSSRPLRALYMAAFNSVVPLAGRVVSGHPWAYGYLPRSVARFDRSADGPCPR